MCKMNLLKEFQTYVSKEALFEPKHKLLLAISGGLDSMVLLHVLKHFGYQVSCAHANFQLRGDESTQDALFVKNYCDSIQIPYFEEIFDTKKYASESGLGTQEAARNLRYQWFNKLLVEKSFDFILTAHHANDQAETILFHLIRGSGARGLSGMLPKNKQLVRPLLFAKKQDLESYAQLHDIPHRNDSSNESDKYSRNFIRHQIIPKVQEIQAGFITSMQHHARLMQATAHYFEEHMQGIKNSIWSKWENDLAIEAEKLCQLAYPDIVLYEMIHTYGFNILQCQQAIDAWKTKNSGAIFHGNSWRLLVDRNYLLLSTDPIAIPEITIQSLPFQFQNGHLQYTLEICDFTGFEENVWWLDASLLTFPLTIRAVSTGDKFIPLGLSQYQKISDFLINKKVNQFAKERAWVLMSNHRICMLAPFQISNEFKLTNTPQQALKISQKKEG